MKTLVLSIAGFLLPALPAAAATIEGPSYADLGKAYLADHGKVADASLLPIEKIRSDWCVHLELGAFDPAFPFEYLSEKKHFEQLKVLSTVLLEMQIHWVAWMGSDPKVLETARADIQSLQAWIKAWRPAALANVARAEDRDLYVLMGAKEPQLKARDRLRELLCKPDVLGVAPRDGMPVRILFAPTRREFVELIGYMGLADPAKQADHWVPDATEWTNFWIGWDFVIALEYPPWSPDPKFHTGLPMDKFSKTGLEEHALLQAGNALQWLVYGADGAPYIHQAVAMNLAIAVCGQLNALEGDGWGYGTTGGRTNPYERFVPGGNSSGGLLPPIPAASQDTLKKGRWREGLGADYFALPLRKGQKNGLKMLAKEGPEHLAKVIAEDKAAHFLLVAPDESDKYVVSAPFFGPAAKEKPYPPTSVILDYREFFRAYKSGFTHWLKTESDPKDPKGCEARFRDLLRKMHGRDPESPFEDLVQEIYSLPLSAKNGETDSLEWRYLEWLARG
ncbi:MAG: hypothetical protein ACKVXR_09020 [Planctomycetota bacterium]